MPLALDRRARAADWPRLAPGLLAAACFATLAFALTAQYAFGYEPCALCTYQRTAYATAGGVAVAGFLGRDRPGLRALLLALCGLILLAGAGVAAYHVGVEQHWWGSAWCAAPAGGGIETLTLSDLKAQLAAGTDKPCDIVDWRLFGLSMATYNIGIFGILGFAALAAAATRRRGSQ